jgi:hypothetical protein
MQRIQDTRCPKVILGKEFVAVTQEFRYRTAAPGHKVGSPWDQVLVKEMHSVNDEHAAAIGLEVDERG